jgi:hypothetical protein
MRVQINGQALLDVLEKKPLIALLLLWFPVAVLYFPAYEAGMVTDFTDTLWLFKTQSFAQFIWREGIGHESLYLFTQVLLYLLITIFSKSTVGWSLLFTVLHSVTGLLLLRFLSKLFGLMGVPKSFGYALFGVTIWLLSPVQAEVLIWKATFHYFLALILMFGSLIALVDYISRGRSRDIAIAIGLFVPAMFSLELFYLTPFYALLICVLSRFAGNVPNKQVASAIWKICLPLLLLWVGHLLLYHGIYGKWIAHLEVDKSMVLNPSISLPKLEKYLLYILCFYFFLPPEQRQSINTLAEQPAAMMALVALVAIVALITVFLFQKMKPLAKSAVTVFWMGLGASILILPMWFNDLMMTFNDRYYYLLSAFIYTVLAIGISSLPGLYTKWVAGITYLLFAIGGTAYITLRASEGAELYWTLVRRVPQEHNGPILFLNLPENYSGLTMFVSGEPSNIKINQYVYRDDRLPRKMYDVAGYNMLHTWDGAHVTVIDSLTLKVTLNQWGTWWWYGTLGASSYENDLYKLEMTDPGHEYLLHLKHHPANLMALYQQGQNWREVDWSKPGKEQFK